MSDISLNPPPNLLSTPTSDNFYKYPLRTYILLPPKLAISGELPTPYIY